MIDLNAAVAGLLAGLTLIVAIGAQNAYVLRQGLRREHVGAVVAVCAISDAVLIMAGVAGIGEKTAASLLTSHGDLEGILTAASRKDSPIAGGVRAKLGAAIDYLAVAPTVVAVARELPLGVDWDQLRLPRAPARPERFAQLTEELGLSGSASRVLAALARER